MVDRDNDVYGPFLLPPVRCLILNFHSFIHIHPGILRNDVVCSSMPPLWPFIVAYIVWVMWIDKAPERGGRMSHSFRSISFWRYFAEYYPASCVTLGSH